MSGDASGVGELRSETCGIATPDALHRFAREVFHELERQGLNWALLRAPTDLKRMAGGDIDVLVDPREADHADALLRRLGFVRRPGTSGHYLRYDPSSDVWVWYHLTSELSFAGGRIETQMARSCLARRVRNSSLPCLAPGDAFWSLLLHCVYDKRHIAPHHRRTLQHLAPQAMDGGPLASFLNRLCTSGPWTSRQVVDMVRAGEWARAEEALDAADPRSRPGNPSKAQRIQRTVHRRLRRIGRQRHVDCGLTVAILGPDGAGKSTLVEAIAASWKLPVRTMYMGLTGGLLKHAVRLRVPGLVFAARALIIWSRFLRAQVHRMRGRLVVFDRYTLDAAVPHPERLNALRRLARRMDRYLCPLPDLVLVLDAPGEVMHRRKGEYSPEMLEDWRRHFLALARHLPQVEVIDAMRDRESVRREAVERIWRRYEMRSLNA